MKIPDSHFVFKKKDIGRSRGKGVFYGKTKGGLHMIYLEGGKMLGVGSHIAIAKHLAKRQDADIEWLDLAKSDESYTLSMFEHLLPKYEEITRQLQEDDDA